MSKQSNNAGAKQRALGAVRMLVPTLGGALAFTALGQYAWLLVSVLTGWIGWTMLEDSRSKKTFLYCLAAAGFAGVVAHTWFLSPNGDLSDRGFILLLPVVLALMFYGMKIYSIESGGEDE